MVLTSFGSILGFAEELEKQHQEYCLQAAVNPGCDQYHALFTGLARGAKKRVAEVQRIRRENVSEMVLAGVEGLRREAFFLEPADGSALAAEEVISTALALTDRSIGYYQQAAAQLKDQADVSRALKTLAKKHTRERATMAALGG
ncbi:hypothetical protein [Desulfogranum mediterraneum]|uniref:hypothetical protein n=1 Tax=Desulfogranum mediterraneum TaxID=160661 RepID=UPI0003F7C2D5|nr:hypothetical protein [Desulfogranum mediterraneum]